MVVKSLYLQPCCFCQKFFFPSSIDWIQKFLQAKETTFHQASNKVGTLTDLINNWKNYFSATAISDEDSCNE
jgi:hypothetical protein